MSDDAISKQIQYHEWEAIRIQSEIDKLTLYFGDYFQEDGAVKTVLRNRVKSEQAKAQKLRDENKPDQKDNL